MSSEKIKISLIHISDRTIHEAIIVLTGDCPNCGLLFTCSVSRDIEVKDRDYFKCLLNIMIQLM